MSLWVAQPSGPAEGNVLHSEKILLAKNKLTILFSLVFAKFELFLSRNGPLVYVYHYLKVKYQWTTSHL